METDVVALKADILMLRNMIPAIEKISDPFSGYSDLKPSETGQLIQSISYKIDQLSEEVLRLRRGGT